MVVSWRFLGSTDVATEVDREREVEVVEGVGEGKRGRDERGIIGVVSLLDRLIAADVVAGPGIDSGSTDEAGVASVSWDTSSLESNSRNPGLSSSKKAGSS